MTTKLGLYSVFDVIANQWAPTFEQLSPATAWRVYQNFLKNSNFNPEDYFLGYFGDITRNNERVDFNIFKTAKLVHEGKITKNTLKDMLEEVFEKEEEGENKNG